MKTRLQNWLFKLAIKFIAIRLVRSYNKLTPDYLLKKGFIKKGGEYIEPNVKGRNRVTIEFENHYYRVYHSDKKTFIALEISVEWFEAYYLIIHPNNGRFELAGI